jgi:DNA invertase Pin-like site-specific DNA recombinase
VWRGEGVRAKIDGVITAYVRVSSQDQNLATQRDAISRAARARGHRIGRWFEEKQSGKSLARPVLGELRELVRRGVVTTLYVFRIDRLTRSGIRDTLALLEELRGAGCKVITLADGFSLEGPGCELVLAAIAWAAQMERAALGERISAARARVRRWGRPRRDVDVARARELEAKGKSIRQIAAALKVPRTTVQRALARSSSVPKKVAARKASA